MKKEANIMITLDNMKLISVNALYKAGMIKRGSKYTPYIYKCSEAKKFEATVHDQLRAIDWSEHVDWIRNTKEFCITNQYILKTGIKRRDVSNFTKLADDCFVSFMKNELGISNFDDAKFVEEHLYKSIIPGGDKEYLCISIKPSNFDTRFDHIELPEKILLHGEYPKGKKGEWSKAGIKATQPKEWNTDLWVVGDLTPELTSQVIHSLVEHAEKGYCIVALPDESLFPIFTPFTEGHGNLVLTTDPLATLEKLRG